MRIAVITLFPDLIERYLQSSVIGRAYERGLFDFKIFDLRAFGTGKRKQVDDRLCGGTPGMLLQVEPIWRAYLAALRWQFAEAETELAVQITELAAALDNLLVLSSGQETTAAEQLEIRRLNELLRQLTATVAATTGTFYLSPKGFIFEQNTAKKWASEYERLIFLCGHYEGVDARIFSLMPWCEVSLGNFVMTGGELAVLAMIDAALRMVPGVLRNTAAYEGESLYSACLEAEQYTQPADYYGYKVPAVLLEGNHKLQAQWKRRSSLYETFSKRADLFNKLELSCEDITLLQEKLLNEHADNI